MKKYYVQSRRRGISTYNKARKANRISQGLRRKCRIKHVIEGKIEGRIDVTGRRRKRRKQLLDDFKKIEDTGN
jgi:hypothetical protein